MDMLYDRENETLHNSGDILLNTVRGTPGSGKKRLALIIMNVDEKLSMLSLTGKTSNFHLRVKLSSSKVTDVHIPSYTIPLGVEYFIRGSHYV